MTGSGPAPVLDPVDTPKLASEGGVESYCPVPVAGVGPVKAEPGEPVAACVLCDEPTEYAADTPGAPMCPRCEWQQAQRGACSG
ncbi:hypothetical protein [Streptacidiphilus anmyonensis]|uniref:hypothetical protein n=1 Tax=Streptacidiphilus anmyonensis TaxID=405782 RepID=UPI001364B6A3|nr:hypothetical protein [Streptacidiphilus anmyonensis]